MSDPRLITPLLSEYIMGDPISDHHGIRCCPALNTATEEKYIVKIISIPASQRQLDALLLSGAYSSPEEAREYFRSLAADTVEEAKTLQKLAKLEGFQGCEGWQIEPNDEGTGFDVYLLTRYSTTLEHYQRKKCLTHLAAVNLGLDLCAALSVSRRNGWLYVNLKPENIILSETKGYLIGDLGFLNLKSLRYASLPEKYRSAYTAPEIQDAYSTLNPTMDIYAVGRILSLVFHGGVLPEDAPAYADQEMLQIISKACAEDPADRWQDPEEMGQALVSYMQSHSVNDDPIVPLPEPEPEPEPEEVTPEEPEITEDSSVEEIPEESARSDDAVEEDSPVPPDFESEAESSEDLPVVEVPQEEIPEAEEEPEQFVIDGFLIDDSLQDAVAVAQLSDDVISDEVSEMLAQADELIAHQAPEPVVAPEPIDVPIPEPILPEPEPEPEEEIPAEEPDEDPQEPPAPQEDEKPATDQEPADSDEEEDLPQPAPRNRHRLGIMIGVLALLLVLLASGLGIKYYYDNIYLQNVSGITANGSEDWLIVSLDTQIDNSLLSVTCTDPYGTRITRPVHNNQATFTQLPSATSFTIEVVISGRHQLTGTTTTTYSSDAQTTILDFKAIAGSTDGSVILNFSVQGPDSTSGWMIKYSTEGGPEFTAPCSSHSAMISGLEVGKTYSFRLVPKDDLYVVAGDTTQFTAMAVILPQNMTFYGFENNVLIAEWAAPDGVQVNSWTVRCYNSAGYDATFTVAEPRIELTDLNISQSYTLDIKAEGMLEGKQMTLSANSVTFKEMLVDYSDPSKLVIYWPYEGTAPKDGWLLHYSVDGGQVQAVTCEKNSFTLDRLVPGGRYSIQIQLPPDVDYFGNPGTEFQVPDADLFSGYDVSAQFMSIQMCKRPNLQDWTHDDVEDDAYTNAFILGDSAGLVLRLSREYVTSPDEIIVTYLLRRADGTFLQMDDATSTWTDLWFGGYCELDLPYLPTAVGEYTLEILFNNAYITQEPIHFTVSEAPAQPEDPKTDT